MLQADDCVRQVDHLQSLTAPPSSLTHYADSCFYLNVPDFHVERKGLWQYPISSVGWDSNGFCSSLEMPFVYRVHKTLTGEHVEAVIVAQSVPANTLWVSL